jgi:2-hydroxychromene-2-carboxylate isomerase
VSTRLDFYYDFSSPYAYLGSTQVGRLAAAHGAELIYHPILLGALFRAIGTPDVPVATFPEPKRRYVGQDLTDWAAHWKVPFAWPSRFPMRTVTPLRLALSVGPAEIARVSAAIFTAYWAHDRDIADPKVLGEIARECRIADETLERATRPDPTIKQALIDETKGAEQAGVCGVPSFLVRGHLFWGQDRLDLVEKTLSGWDPPM